MPEPGVLPYGTWPSPITTDLIVERSVRLGGVWPQGDTVFWDELRPGEGGRVVVVRRRGDGPPEDVLPEGWSARTRAHEYGGAAWWIHGGTLFFANWDDQRLHRLDLDEAGTRPRPITRDPLIPQALRYADGRVTPDGRWVVCVRESHEAGGEAVNELVAVPAGGGEPQSLVRGPDFVSFPRVSPDGANLAWTQWNHPAMPWDGTELWVAELAGGADDLHLVDPAPVAGGLDESIFQPEWSPAGVLHFVSDRSEWWNIHRFSDAGRPASGDTGTCVWRTEKEVATPQWVFGMSRYAFVGDDRGEIVAAASAHGVDELWLLDPGPDASDTVAEPLSIGLTSITGLRADAPDTAVFVGASFRSEPAVVELRIGEARQHRPRPRLVRPPRDLGVDPAWYSEPDTLTFPTSDGGVAHALHYPPTNPDHVGPEDELPPLLVKIHGGPTGQARPQLDLGTQFWTSRGFAVVDVNYRGSTGYGRSYRRLLDGRWGVADVDDCAAAARYLADQGLVDGARLAIRGSSAGGYTALCALVRTEAFSAGTSSYGVTDLEALARDTHKFESRYLDTLVGPYPDRRDLYEERSPIHHVAELDRPLLVLQGEEDEIVPPSQARVLVDALRDRGIPFAYLEFEDEQHGFRQAATIRRALDAELYFYSRIFGFAPPADVEALEVENL